MTDHSRKKRNFFLLLFLFISIPFFMRRPPFKIHPDIWFFLCFFLLNLLAYNNNLLVLHHTCLVLSPSSPHPSSNLPYNWVIIPTFKHQTSDIKYQILNRTGGTKPRISRCGRTKVRGSKKKEKITSLALALALQGKLPWRGAGDESQTQLNCSELVIADARV